MRVSGYEYLRNSIPDFNTSEKIDAATPSAERVDDIHKEEKAVTIDFSGSERLHGREDTFSTRPRVHGRNYTSYCL